MTRAEHIVECRTCRIGVNCIEWYRRGWGRCWCGQDHFESHDGELRCDDVVTETFGVIGGFIGLTWSPWNWRRYIEGITWIRGHWNRDHAEGAALVAAYVLRYR